ncbi:hypothetical protein [Streptomyces griseiscabiei]|uniref:Uncharacterized protein n=1 Tax=Streptomyces griseiscabiei TaxID=2993540 RepID=A0ABU4L6K0_9ACTN|nr:hypothetical protein [Streptomyces griseiscabiei]MDX2911238.1 hypothetical protein [Streptomyces griseiscabiei]
MGEELARVLEGGGTASLGRHTPVVLHELGFTAVSATALWWMDLLGPTTLHVELPCR